MKFARITLSDRASAGVYEDRSGPAIEQFFADRIADEIEWQRVLIPDERAQIETSLLRACDEEHCVLVVTTGGTGGRPSGVIGSSSASSSAASATATGSSRASTVAPSRIIVAPRQETSRPRGTRDSPSRTPFYDPASRTRTPAPRRTICACSREASASARAKSQVSSRPMR